MKTFYSYGRWYRTLCVLITLLAGLASRSQAQVYYLTSDGVTGTLSAADALNRMDFDGSNMTAVVPSVTTSPSLLALDPTGNRAFVYEAVTANRGIKVYSSLNGTPVLDRTLPVPAAVSAIEYDATSDYVYFLTSDGAAGTLSAADALNRIKADGTGTSQVLVASIASAPAYLTLNIAGNRAFVYEGLTANRGIKTVDLTNNTVSGTLISVPATATALDYAPSNGYLYYLTTDGTNTSTGTADALYRVPATGGASSLVVASLTSFPAFMALDLPNDRIYVVDNFASTPRAFKVVRPSDGTVTATYTQATLFVAVEIGQAPTSTTVTAVNATSANPTNANTVSYSVTFGSSVTGLSFSNFSLLTSGLSGSTITSLSGSGTTYTVTVNTGSGSGTLRLYLANDTGISPDISTALPFAGQTYTIDRTAPTVVLSSSTAASGSTTSTTPFAFTATFSESVTGFGAGDITTNGTVSGFAGSGPTYTFNITPATGTATTVTVAANAAQDAATNGSTVSNTYSLTYAVAPSVTTATASSVASTSALLGGSVTADGGAAVTSRGVVYSLTSTNATPTIGGTGVTQDANGSGQGSYLKSITGLTASTSYTVRAYATNSLATSYGAPVTFTTAAPLSATTTQTNLACNGGTTGSATVTVSGGLPPYSYSWSPNVSTTARASNLSAGLYTVTVTDASGATISRTFTLTQPGALAAATTQNNVTTNGGANGSATITVSGGTPSYSYSWSPSVSTTATASNLSAGTYTVTATDANGCTIARTFTITQPAATTSAPVVVAPANGSLVATSTPTYSGTAPAGSTVTVYVDNVSSGTTTATGGSFSLTPTAALADGSHTVYATAQLSGQPVSANSPLNTFVVDATAPTATLSTTAGSATSTSPIPFSVSFSETVTGFAANDIAVTNGTVTGSTVSGSGPYTFTVTPTANGTVTVSIRANAAQDAAGNGSLASAAVSVTYTAPITATTWTGTISTDWFTAGNWTAGVPTTTIDATIPAGTTFSPAIGSSVATTRSLTLNSGAILNQSDGTLDVRGNLTSNGTFVPTGGTVVLGTSAVQNGPSIQGSARIRFWNLSVNATGVLLSTSAGASVRRLLTLSGALAVNSNPFVLESDATGTALVVNSNSNGSVSGTATVQRYLDASGNTGTSGYRHYSAPVRDATVSSLSTSAYGGAFTAQVNPAYNTADPNQLTLATYPNVFSYDESKIAASPAVSFSDFDKGYQSPASLSDALTVGRGYAVQIGNAEKVQFTGQLNNNTQTISGLTYATGSASAGWALVGNPYPAPLDWRTVGTAPGSGLNGVDGAAYVFQSTSAYSGRYTSFTNNVGAGTGLIASGQGFFVRASTPGTTGSITLTNGNRLTSYASPAFQRTAETRPLLRLSLGLGSQPATVATAQDETFVYFEAGATASYDGRYDAYKLANPSGYYLGSVTPGSAPLGLSIDGRAPLATTTEIPLWVSLPAGTYSLTATELLNFATLAGGTAVQLRDALAGTITDLAATPSYSFAVAANAPYAGRFSLVFRPSSPLATPPSAALAQATASLFPNPATSATALSVTGLPSAVTGLQVEILDMLGRPVAHYALPVRAGRAYQSLATDYLASSLYLLRLTALGAQGQVQGTLPTQRLLLHR